VKPSLMGHDSDHPRGLGDLGREGVAIDTLDDMETLFAGIPMGDVSTSMTINAPVAVMLAFYVVAAERQGAPPEQLAGTIQTDILKEYIAQKEWCFPIDPAMRLVTDMVEFCARRMPRWHPISISGYHIREAGSTAQQELAYTLKDGMSNAVDSPVWPWSSRYRKRSFVSSAVPKPANWRIVHSRPRFIDGYTPRVSTSRHPWQVSRRVPMLVPLTACLGDRIERKGSGMTQACQTRRSRPVRAEVMLVSPSRSYDAQGNAIPVTTHQTSHSLFAIDLLAGAPSAGTKNPTLLISRAGQHTQCGRVSQ
jgi:hypothetical protein